MTNIANVKFLPLLLIFFGLLFSACNEKPDLVITRIEAIGEKSVNSAGEIELPVRVVVKNSGNAAVNGFGLITQYILPNGTYEAPFRFQGLSFEQDHTTASFLSSLTARSKLTVYGKVIFPKEVAGWTVALKAKVVCCDGENLTPEHEHIVERYDDNNESFPIQVSLAMAEQ